MTRQVLLTTLQIGDTFFFDGEVLTVSEPPQTIFGLVEVWVEEWDAPFEGTDSMRVELRPLTS